MAGYWPFWAGALALGFVGTLHFVLTRRTLGVSGSYQKVLNAKAEAEALRAEAAMFQNPAAIEAAFLAATAAEFGVAASPAPAAPAEPAPMPAMKARVPWTANALFLLMLAVGALGAHLLRGGSLKPSFTLGPTFEAFFGSGPLAALVLIVGGALVGFGTRMAGGCTSGHGLSGVSRLQKGSLLATAAFFGTGVVASLIFAKVLQ